jgi:hypothetical protein
MTSSLVLLVLISVSGQNIFAGPGDCEKQPDGSYKITAPATYAGENCVPTVSPGFDIPSLNKILTFAIRAVFIIGGLAALFFLLLGAIAWITSGGDKDAVGKAQAKIQAAVIGVILIAVMLAIIVTLEQVIFARKICLGISCPLSIPSLL